FGVRCRDALGFRSLFRSPRYFGRDTFGFGALRCGDTFGFGSLGGGSFGGGDALGFGVRCRDALGFRSLFRSPRFFGRNTFGFGALRCCDALGFYAFRFDAFALGALVLAALAFDALRLDAFRIESGRRNAFVFRTFQFAPLRLARFVFGGRTLRLRFRDDLRGGLRAMFRFEADAFAFGQALFREPALVRERRLLRALLLRPTFRGSHLGIVRARIGGRDLVVGRRCLHERGRRHPGRRLERIGLVVLDAAALLALRNELLQERKHRRVRSSIYAHRGSRRRSTIAWSVSSSSPSSPESMRS
ncbi:MAG: hypothetical protein IAI48_07865, partial [Candidatus Eremiobacteraeota bacterium]|nr:hypothetical protein [Candidatus Eremiobacteraeota bacterium]